MESFSGLNVRSNQVQHSLKTPNQKKALTVCNFVAERGEEKTLKVAEVGS